MSVSHYFYIDIEELKHFPEELLKAMTDVVKENEKCIRQFVTDSEHIFVEFTSNRPGCFYITTKPEPNDGVMNFKDKIAFTFTNYHPNKQNELLCKMILLCKYYLRENLVFSTEDIGGDGWEVAEEFMKAKGYNITSEFDYDNRNPKIYIDGVEVCNTVEKRDVLPKYTLVRFTPDGPVETTIENQ